MAYITQLKTELEQTTANLRGMDSDTGKMISGVDYLNQRILDALLTPQGSQVLLRERGSTYEALSSEPMNSQGVLKVTAAASSALKSELSGVPDFTLSTVTINLDQSGANDMHRITVAGEFNGTAIEVNA